MIKYKRSSGLTLLVALLGSAAAGAAENGITKEDIKRLEINAFAEEMQSHIKKSVSSELQNSMETKPLDIQAELRTGVEEVDSIPAEPSVSAR